MKAVGGGISDVLQRIRTRSAAAPVRQGSSSAVRQTWPGLPPERMQNPSVYVVESDLAELRGLVDEHRAELQQWRRRDGLSPTALVIRAVLSVFRGLRGGRDGCGGQVPMRAWSLITGRSERMCSYAFAELAAAGEAWRRPRLINHEWVDASGVPRKRADVHAVAYLSPLGAVRVTRRYEKKRRGETRRKGVLRAAGLVGKLLKTLSQKLRLIAVRVAAMKIRFRPTALLRDRRFKTKDRRAALWGRAQLGRSSTSRPHTPEASAAGPPGAGMGGGLDEQLRLFRQKKLTVETAWPALWKPIDPIVGRTRRHWWLIREFGKLVERLSAAVLREDGLLSDRAPASRQTNDVHNFKEYET